MARLRGRAGGKCEIVGVNSRPYSADMNQVSGTYRNGMVVPDEPVDWPEGMHVKIVCESGENGQRRDICFDGSPWEDSPEAIRRWREWFDSLEPVFAGEELQHFETEMRPIREEQKASRPRSRCGRRGLRIS